MEKLGPPTQFQACWAAHCVLTLCCYSQMPKFCRYPVVNAVQMAMMQMVEGSLCDVQCNVVVDWQSDYGSSKQVEISQASMVVLCLCPNLATRPLSERVPKQHSECRFGT